MPLSKTHSNNPETSETRSFVLEKSRFPFSVSFLNVPVWDVASWVELELEELKKVRKNLSKSSYPDPNQLFIQVQVCCNLLKISKNGKKLEMFSVTCLDFLLGTYASRCHFQDEMEMHIFR